MKGARSIADSKTSDAKLKKKGAGSQKVTKKAAKDPNKPKRPPTAFLVFMEDFRKQYKEKNPNNKSVAAVGKAGGEKWKSLSDAEKAPYLAKAEKKKSEYNMNMNAYNKKLAGGKVDDDSDKSKSEVHDESDDNENGQEDEN